MKDKKNFAGVVAVLAVVAVSLMTGANAWAQTETVLYSFGENGEYSGPMFSPVVGPDGALYGSVWGGSTGSSVYQLTLSQDGSWSETIIASQPSGSVVSNYALVGDSAGNLYGATAGGGEYDGGTVFELSPGPAGWTETILHSFSLTGKDGNFPSGGLILDNAGNIYGTTTFGGGTGACERNGCGTVFELSPGTGGTWSEAILHVFVDKGEDGEEPNGALVMDPAGNLYGTTQYGGTGFGVAFELMPAVGPWKEKMLHRFLNNGTDGYSPLAGLALDSKGNLFGTTPWGGTHDTGPGDPGGTAYELSPTPNGGWEERIIHNFGYENDGGPELVALLVDSADNLYGTTTEGGLVYSGDVFELSPSIHGSWKETRLHNFHDTNGSDGTRPTTGLVFGPSGVLYGVTGTGGTYNLGTVYEVVP
jgi:uncharacterized repeat protein (TIGR03803 family)